MKKILLVAAAAAIAVSANAQFTSGGATAEPAQGNYGSLADQMRKGNSQSFNYNEPAEYKGRFNLGYNMWSTMPDEGDGVSYNGFYLEWLAAISCSQSIPLYFDFGINFNYDYYSDEDKFIKSSNLFQLAIPLQVEYRLPVGNSFHISPYLGLVARINIFGDGKHKVANVNNRGKVTYTEKSVNYFDKDDMGGSDFTWKRFQLGWNIGVNLDIKKFTIGLSYGTDFMEISKKCKSSTFKVGIGFNY